MSNMEDGKFYEGGAVQRVKDRYFVSLRNIGLCFLPIIVYDKKE